ncbi:hypothetical protein [Morganella morganii]|uniref:hypothetical protein n=1 Tax=Morganella morganii TaxID=582 RepID=UPI001C45243B|nr:hypothetical protein [Morganella morganii]QXO64950.1 hypothetical protein JC825_16525 [Morganella morganii]
MKVTNINGSGNNKCKCDSWIKHWEKFSSKKADKCCVKGCSSAAVDGAHVHKSGSTDGCWYIVPFCHAHNTAAKDTVLELNAGVDFEPANVSKTCGKSK